MMARGFLLLMLLATTIRAVEATARATVFLKPNLTNVIVNIPVILECYTYENGYSFLSFSFSGPQKVSTSSSPVTNIPGGGIKRNTTFTLTTTNVTEVLCYAYGTGLVPIPSQPVTIFAQGAMDDFRTCKLPNHLFFNWTSAFTLNGFVIQYNITDNLQNKTIYVPHYSVPLRSGTYQANITAIVTTAASQAVHRENRMINVTDTVSLSLRNIFIYKVNTVLILNSTVQLNDLNETTCLFNNSIRGKLTVCNNSKSCSDFPATIEYRDRKLISSCKVDLSTLFGRRFEVRLCFEYLGKEIETKNEMTSMHDLQNITITRNCLTLHMIKGSSVPKIYLQFLKSGEKMLEHQVNVLNDTFILCLPIAYNETHNIFVYEPGSWDLRAYDDPKLMNEEPAFKLHNINVKLISVTEGTANVTASSSTIQEARVGIITVLLFVSIMVFIIII